MCIVFIKTIPALLGSGKNLPWRKFPILKHEDMELVSGKGHFVYFYKEEKCLNLLLAISSHYNTQSSKASQTTQTQFNFSMTISYISQYVLFALVSF